VSNGRNSFSQMFDPWRAAWSRRREEKRERRPQPMPKHAPPTATKRINLALQGGGAHGAFTWGVLDYILEDGRLAIDGISGASAGAMNAVMLADGLARGGADGARTRLAEFWRAASRDGNLPDSQRVALDRLMSFLPANASPLQSWMGAWTKYLSPYDLNPLNINPLKDLVERFVDFEAIRRCTDLRLYISATNVHTGKLKVFAKEEITAEAVMASAALPYFFRAVEIDGVPYWDGGYTGNPPLYPLLNWSFSPDVLVVQINPLMRSTTPTSNEEILNRINEITFNSSLSSEIRVVELLSELLTKGELKSTSGNYRPTRLHRINFGGTKTPDAGSKFNNDFDFFETLHKSGRRAARRFLDAHFDDIGVRSTIEHLPEPPPEAASPDAAA
jgi:NTE family protein